MKNILKFLLSLTVLIISVSCFSESQDTAAVNYIKNTNYVYRGISGTYEYISKIYPVSSFVGAEFVGYETRRDPKNSMATLVTLRYITNGIDNDILTDKNVSIFARKKIKEAVPNLAITWRVNSLIGLKITPYNFYASDAIQVYKEGVDGIINFNRMIKLSQ